MVSDKCRCRYFDFFCALALTAVLAAAARIGGGFYYDLNDDVLIKDILSGVYTGTPDGHTMQILFPLGFLLRMLYCIPGVPVFGLFLCLCQFGSIFVFVYRTLGCLECYREKMVALAAWGCFFTAACLEHLVFVQYTVAAGMLGAAAVFWLATSGAQKTAAGFLKENLWALLLFWACFNLRSEMGLLLLPLAGITGLCKWFSEEHPFSARQLGRYLGVFAVLVTGMGLCLGAEKLAYHSEGWQEFSRYFNARTTVYDYQIDVVEDYEENKEIYEMLDVSAARQQLLKNYNFGVDDRMDADFMEDLASLAKQRENGGLFRKDLRTALWELVRGHFLGKGDFCLNAGMLLMALLLFVLGWFMEKKKGMWQSVLIIAVGSTLWLFLLLRGRMPVRLTTPLYLTMTAACVGLFLNWHSYQHRSKKEEPEKQTWGDYVRHWVLLTAAMGVILCAVLTVPGRITDIAQQLETRREVNTTNEAVLAYCGQNPEVLFLEDVYSTVSFSEKMGIDRAKPFNYDLLGGWMVKSPLTQQKLQAFGFETMGEAVRGNDRVRILTEAESNLDWLMDFLAEEGIAVKAEKTDSIAGGAVDVYRIILK